MLVALGGNALQRAGGDGTWTEMATQMRATAPALAQLARDGHELIVTHGNGPQVGALLRQNELAAREVPPRPMFVLDAQSEGEVGFLVQQELSRALAEANVPRTVVTFISRMEVALRDPAFRRPTKPVGVYYSEPESRLLRKRHDWTMEFDGARGGWRRVVPSPKPVRWLEAETVRAVLRDGGGLRTVPVVAGGGGVPVVAKGGGTYEGIEAVIDKDRAAAVVARELGVDLLAIVTDVPGAAVGFRKPWERWLGEVSAEELAEHVTRGEFAEGSMGPKVDAGLAFLAGGGRRFLITDVPSLARALRGEAGTRVQKS